MLALLLAAGRSRRCWPLGDKNFLKFGEKTLIEYQLAALKKAGVKKCIIVGGAHNLTTLRALFPKEIIVEQKNLDTGMAGAVMAGQDHLTEPTLILSTNDIFEPHAIKKIISSKTGSGALLAYRVKNYFPGGYLKLGTKQRIEAIIEKPQPGTEPSNLITIVCHFFREPNKLITALKTELQPKKRGLFRTKESQTDDAYERALAVLFQTETFTAVEYSGPWQALKYPWHLLTASTHYLSTLKNKRSRDAVIAKTAVIKGPVVIESGVKIFDHATIIGPAYLGKNVIVGTGSLVRDSIIGSNSVVGSGTEVARSHLGEHVWLHRNYVGDSILGDNVSLGSGAVTGNLRLDEGVIRTVVQENKVTTALTKFGAVIGTGSRIGINVSLMPGVLIGIDTFIGSGLTISTNIPDRTFVKGETTITCVPNTTTVAIRK